MTSLEEKAQETPEVRLARDSAYSAYRLESTELTDADELSDEGEFPQFGEFAECEIPSNGDSTAEVYVEVPQNLAAQLVEAGIGEGDEFRIGEVSKVDGEWQYDVKAGAEKS